MQYTREQACKAWLTYGMIRADILSGILEKYGSAEAVYDDFVKTSGRSMKGQINEYAIAQLYEASSKKAMHEMLVNMQKHHIGIISQEESLYPDSLRNIQMPPVALFYRGNLECLMGKCVAVIGSRKASAQGIENTKKICCELSRAGVTIISGLAMGIDAAAHEGCLEGGSPTAAVLGCGIDVDYPMENYRLKQEIVKRGGVLLSEYPLGSRANKYVFQTRNRIMSGLGKALLMMEGQIRSGSMLTVHHALDQGREVYAYPGIPGTEWAEGAHQLLREGANYFTSAQDILEDMGWDSDFPTEICNSQHSLPPLNEEQHQVFSLLSQGEMSFDQLAASSGLESPTLSVALTMLQMMGLIKALPGKSYCRV